jgi:hypothetical protein
MLTALDRARVLAYRFAVHGLGAAGDGETVLATGVQDYPPGRSAALALRLRNSQAPTVLVHSIRGAMHLHRAADLGRLAAALRLGDGRDLARQSMGPFGAELAEAGVGFDAALDEVAGAMRAAVAGGTRPTKGELSGAVSPQVDPRLAPWCEGCGVAHVQDHLFRLATLQAGLVIELDAESPSQFRFRAADASLPVDPAYSRAELVRAFLATFGPAKPAHLASWLGHTPSSARSWWDLIADELRPVSIDGGKHWAHVEHVDMLEKAPAPDGVRLLPPYDPVTELADRNFLVPDPARRRAVWRAAANPGIVLVDGEIAGVWRQRRAGKRLVLRVEPFDVLTDRQRRMAEPDAATIADQAGASDVELAFDR